MDDRFYNAFFEGDHKVLGVTLKPFSLWHQCILEAIDSPLVNGKKVMPEDVLLAIEVFKISYPNQPRFNLSPSRVIRLLRSRVNKKYTEKLVDRVSTFIKANTSLPRFRASESQNMGGGLTAPPVMQTVVSLIKYGWSEQEAWNMSVGRARWYEAAMMERESSSIKFLYETELDAFRAFMNRSDDEVYAQAVQDLGQEQADRWWKNRKENI